MLPIEHFNMNDAVIHQLLCHLIHQLLIHLITFSNNCYSKNN